VPFRMGDAAVPTANSSAVAESTDADESPSSETSNEEQFVNTGLRKWEKARSQWLSHKSPDCPSDPTTEQPRTAVNIDVDEIIDLIISNKWRDAPSPRRGAGSRGTKIEGCSFGQPIPLPQMIDVLLDLWEAEGLEM